MFLGQAANILVISGWTFFGHAFFDVRSYCTPFHVQKSAGGRGRRQEKKNAYFETVPSFFLSTQVRKLVRSRLSNHRQITCMTKDSQKNTLENLRKVRNKVVLHIPHFSRNLSCNFHRCVMIPRPAVSFTRSSIIEKNPVVQAPLS